jgi:hypothetical protein
VSVTPDPRPTKRYKASQTEWELLRQVKMGWCRVCELQAVFGAHAVEFHHLVGRDLGGDDFPENIVPLCAEHHKMVEERSPVACIILRASLTSEEYEYVIAKKGLDFLTRYYPAE